MSQGTRGLRARLARLEGRMQLDGATIVMPDGKRHDVPGAGLYFLRLFRYAGQLRYGVLTAEQRRPKYEQQLAWLRSAVELDEPEGSSIGNVVMGLRKSPTFTDLFLNSADYPATTQEKMKS